MHLGDRLCGRCWLHSWGYVTWGQVCSLREDQI